jgi:hypothetical protein
MKTDPYHERRFLQKIRGCKLPKIIVVSFSKGIVLYEFDVSQMLSNTYVGEKNYILYLRRKSVLRL